MEQISKICIHCGIKTYYDDLIKDKRKKDGVIAVCKSCSNARNKANGVREKQKVKLNQKYKDDPVFHKEMKERMAKYREDFNERILLSNARIRAKKSNIDFDLVEEDIVIPNVCPLMNIPLFRGTNFVKDNSPCIDRIDNTKGYTKNNVRVISYLGNRMKSNATPEQLIYFADHIKEYLGMI